MTTARTPTPPAKSKLQFPYKLHSMLESAEIGGSTSVVSWLPHGKAFQVHNKALFVSEIMPIYFNSSKFKSFQRNLNLWGFETMSQGPDKGAIYHACFVKDQPELCNKMVRQKIKGTSHGSGSSASSIASPSTYESAPTLNHGLGHFAASVASPQGADRLSVVAAAAAATAADPSPSPASGLEAASASSPQQHKELQQGPGFATLSSLFAQAERDASRSRAQASPYASLRSGASLGAGAYPIAPSNLSGLSRLSPQPTQVNSLQSHPAPSDRFQLANGASPEVRESDIQEFLRHQQEQAIRTNFPQLKYEQVQEYERLQHEERTLKLRLHQNQQNQRQLLEAVAAAVSAHEQESAHSTPAPAPPSPSRESQDNRTTSIVSDTSTNTNTNSPNALLGLDAIATAASFVPMVDGSKERTFNQETSRDTSSPSTNLTRTRQTAGSAAEGIGLTATQVTGVNADNAVTSAASGGVDQATLAAFCAGAEITMRSFLSSIKNKNGNAAGKVQ